MKHVRKADFKLRAGILFFAAAFLFSGQSFAAGLSLKVQGDAKQGYGVEILKDGKPVARHNGGGEFSAFFTNGERSLALRRDNWRATSWTGDDRHVVLRGEMKSDELCLVIEAQVQYDILSDKLVKKQIRFYQPDMYLLFYEVSNCLEPVDEPAKLWSFDQADCKGGPLREYFPAAGFRTKNGLTVGLLTDAGFRNGWSRIIRRINHGAGPSMVAAREVPDVNLYNVADSEQRKNGKWFVQQTFGEIFTQADDSVPGKPVALPPVSAWRKVGAAVASEQAEGWKLSGQSESLQLSGMSIPFNAEALQTYRINFEYRSPHQLSTRFWDTLDGKPCGDFGLYQDRLPASPDGWKKFESTVYIPSRKGNGASLLIGPGYYQKGGPVNIELRNLVIEQRPTYFEPYHRLEMGRPEAKTVFIYVDDKVDDTLRGYRLASQLHFADAFGFKGSDAEKIIWADTMSLCWQAEPHVDRIICAPSIFYSAASEMYMRDSFLAVSGLHNRELNEAVFQSWADNQGTNGAIGTLIPANVGQRERKSNDSTPHFLMWALKNNQRFGTPLPMDKLRKAAEYCLNTYDPDRDGVCWSKMIMGQNDVISFPKGTTDVCGNQGVWAVTLRTIKELQIPGISETITEDYIKKAETVYRSYYSPELKHMLPARGVTNEVTFDEIWPDFLSLWLFKRPVLDDEMVCNHLDRMPVFLPNAAAPYSAEGGTARPIVIGLKDEAPGWQYLTDTFHPMISADHARPFKNRQKDGVYYNGGSWMRIEICGYVAGKLHGWKKADQAIANRLWAEVNTDPDFPTSQEYLATDPGNPAFGGHRVFAWNAFIFQALEMAGLRTPDMDPDYGKK